MAVVARSTFATVARKAGNNVRNANRLADSVAIAHEKYLRTGKIQKMNVSFIVHSVIVYVRAHKGADRQLDIACFHAKLDCKIIQESTGARQISGELSAIERIVKFHPSIMNWHFIDNKGIPRPVNDNRREINPACPGTKDKKHKMSLQRLRASQSVRAELDSLDMLTVHERLQAVGTIADRKAINAHDKTRKLLTDSSAQSIRARNNISSRDERKGNKPTYNEMSKLMGDSIIIKSRRADIVSRLYNWMHEILDLQYGPISDISPERYRGAFYNGERPIMVKSA